MNKLTKKEKGRYQQWLDEFYSQKGHYPSREQLKSFPVTIKTKDLYFIRCPDTNRIKIGVSDKPASRLYGLYIASPTKLTLDLVVEYGEDLEQHLHKVFSKYRFKGEWFESNPELESMISDFRILCQR